MTGAGQWSVCVGATINPPEGLRVLPLSASFLNLRSGPAEVFQRRHTPLPASGQGEGQGIGGPRTGQGADSKNRIRVADRARLLGISLGGGDGRTVRDRKHCKCTNEFLT